MRSDRLSLSPTLPLINFTEQVFFNFFKPRFSQLRKENNNNNIMISWSRSLGSNGIASEGFVQSKTLVNYVDFTYIFLLNPHHNSRHNINKYYYYR